MVGGGGGEVVESGYHPDPAGNPSLLSLLDLPELLLLLLLFDGLFDIVQRVDEVL